VVRAAVVAALVLVPAVLIGGPADAHVRHHRLRHRRADTAAPRVWTGDAMHHDGAGQLSGVAGVGTVTTPYAEPASYYPGGLWMGISGTDPRALGLVYGEDAGAITAYGNGNWFMSRFVVDVAPGASHTLTRRIGVTPTSGSDPFAVVAAVPAPERWLR